MAAPESTRNARVEARIAPDALAVVRRAAALQGRSVSDFQVAAALKDAQRNIEDAQIIRLSVEDQRRFAELLIDPPPRARAMKRALKGRQRLIVGARRPRRFAWSPWRPVMSGAASPVASRSWTSTSPARPARTFDAASAPATPRFPWPGSGAWPSTRRFKGNNSAARCSQLPPFVLPDPRSPSSP